MPNLILKLLMRGLRVEPLLAVSETYDEIQPDVQEEIVDSEEGVETLEDDDDEFARLCLEVAQSKK